MRRLALVFVAILGLTASALAQGSWFGVNNTLVQFAVEQLSTPGTFEVTAGDVEEPEDGSLLIRDISVADSSGVWLRAGSLSVKWNASRILRGELELPLLRITDLDITRLPDEDAEGPKLKDDGTEDEDGIAWPRSPLTLRVDKLEIVNAHLAEGVGPQEITFDATGNARDEGDIQAVELQLARRDQIRGQIDFAYLRDFATNALKLTLKADEAPGGLVAKAAGFPDDSAAQLRIDGDGPQTDWRLNFAANVEGVFRATGDAVVAYAAPISVETSFELVPGEKMPATARDALSPRATLTTRLTEQAGLIVLDVLDIVGPTFSLRADGQFERESQKMALNAAITGSAALADLVPALDFQGFTFDGKLEGTPDDLRAKGDASLGGLKTAPLDAARLDLAVTAHHTADALVFEAEGLGDGLRLDKLPPALVGEAELAIDGEVVGDVLTLNAARLDSPLLNAGAGGSLNLTNDAVELAYAIATADAAPVAARYGLTVSGEIEAQGTVLRSPDILRLEGDISASNATFDRTRYGDVELAHDVDLASDPKGRLTLVAGGTPYGPVETDTRFTFTAPVLSLSDLTATALGTRIDGVATFDTETTLTSGRIAFDAPDLAKLGRQFGLPIKGQASGTLDLATDGVAQNVVAEIRSGGLTAQDIRVSGLDLKAVLSDVLRAPDGRLTFNAGRIDTGTAILSNTAARASGTLEAANISLSTGGTIMGRNLSASADIVARLGDEPAGTIRRMSVSLGEEIFALAAPAKFIQRGGATRLEGIDLALPDAGRLTGMLGFNGGLIGDIRLSALDLDLVRRLVDGPTLGGKLDAEAKFDTSRARGRLRAGLSNFEPGLNLRQSEPLAATLDVDWVGAAADAVLSLTGDFGDPVRVEARVPIRRSLPLPGLNRNGRLDGRIDWQGETSRLWAAVPAAGTILSGPARVALRVSGTPANPKVDGAFDITDGRFEHLGAGLVLTALNLTSVADETGSLALSLKARDGGEGLVEGQVKLRNEATLLVDANVKADGAVLVRRDDVTARLTTDISVSGPLTALAVAGTIGVDEAEVRLVVNSPPEIVTLDNIRFLDDPVEETDRDGPGLVTLDIAVEAPERIYVRGRGLDSEWKAGLRISGTSAEPRLRGIIERIRGDFSLIGRSFDLETGRIVFRGGAEIDPALDISLARTDNDLTGRIQVSGRASDPEVTFTSTPVLPSGEVLPRLLFGQSRQSLSASQAIQLAVGIQTLMTGEAGVLDAAREGLGVDVLQIDPGTDGNASVKVGKTVAPGVFVGAKKDVSGGDSDAVTVEIDVFEGFKLEGETQSDRSSIGITWKRDF